MLEPKSETLICRVCFHNAKLVGTVEGSYSKRTFRLARCPACGYGFIVDPWLNYDEIYNDQYYAGEGADPLVDYYFELEFPGQSIRHYELAGLATVINDLTGGPNRARRWLDYGCGNGGLVRHLRHREIADALGFEEGAIADKARGYGIPVVKRDDLEEMYGSFDVVTAIEVIEHTSDPVSELRYMKQMLKPGGLLFLTTGNAAPYASRLTKWRYVLPEIHISLFEPRTLEYALAKAGFRPENLPLGPGFDEVLKFKVLKNLHFRQRSWITDRLPARLVAPLADRFTRLSKHPVGWAI